MIWLCKFAGWVSRLKKRSTGSVIRPTESLLRFWLSVCFGAAVTRFTPAGYESAVRIPVSGRKIASFPSERFSSNRTRFAGLRFDIRKSQANTKLIIDKVRQAVGIEILWANPQNLAYSPIPPQGRILYFDNICSGNFGNRCYNRSILHIMPALSCGMC